MYDQKDVQVNVTSVETPQDFCKINTEMKKNNKKHRYRASDLRQNQLLILHHYQLTSMWNSVGGSSSICGHCSLTLRT